jgi:hypothetical protein
MTEPTPSRPVPGPPRPVPGSTPPTAPAVQQDAADENRFGELGEQPVAEHVAVFEAEHGRLQRELGTIDQL